MLQNSSAVPILSTLAWPDYDTNLHPCPAPLATTQIDGTSHSYQYTAPMCFRESHTTCYWCIVCVQHAVPPNPLPSGQSCKRSTLTALPSATPPTTRNSKTINSQQPYCKPLTAMNDNPNKYLHRDNSTSPQSPTPFKMHVFWLQPNPGCST